MDFSTQIIIIAAAVVGLLVLIICITCCCLLAFYKKNKKLGKEKDHTNNSNGNGAQQPLNRGNPSNTSSGSGSPDNQHARNHHHQHNHTSSQRINISSASSHPVNNQRGAVTGGGGGDRGSHGISGGSQVTSNTSAAQTPYSQDETTSSDYPTNGGNTGKWNEFDATFLVHPEQYLSASQASNSGNGSNNKLYGHNNNGAIGPNHQLNTTVTISTSLSNGKTRGMISTTSNGIIPTNINGPPNGVLPLSMNNSIPNNASNHVINQQQQQQQQRYFVQQQQKRKLQDQQSRLHEIVRNARNKLQLIDSKHISFEYEVGRGKFGKVFRALWTDSNTKQQKTVAVKWFKQDEVDQEVFEDFLKEISVAAHLPPHENVLQIYGFCISPYALVTEYVNGGSVEICVSTKHKQSIRSKITIGDIVQMFIDTAKGISHLHTVNIIHRDVAARNLLIEDMTNQYQEDQQQQFDEYKVGDSVEVDLSDNINNNKSSKKHKHRKSGKHKNKKHTKSIPENFSIPRRRVVVCDFGLSRITANPDADSFTNSHVGPLKWMSPESIKQQIYNSKTDVYSFGVVMWEVLCGMPPYPNTKVLSLAVEVISKQTRPYILEWFPRPLQILMQRCWQEIPDYRPTFEDIKNELELFKQELIAQNKINDPLITISAQKLSEQNKTKEKLRNIHDLVNNYLDPSKFHWDQLIKPKLQKLIEDSNKNHNFNAYQAQMNAMQNMQNQQLSLNNDTSISTYYTGNNSSINPQQQLSMMSGLNVSNKRISVEATNNSSNKSLVRRKVNFADNINNDDNNNNNEKIIKSTDDEELRQIPPLMSTESMSITNNNHHGHSPDISVSINAETPTNNIIHHRNHSSKPLNHLNNIDEQQTYDNGNNDHSIHSLGDSVQIEVNHDFNNNNKDETKNRSKPPILTNQDSEVP